MDIGDIMSLEDNTNSAIINAEYVRDCIAELLDDGLPEDSEALEDVKEARKDIAIALRCLRSVKYLTEKWPEELK